MNAKIKQPGLAVIISSPSGAGKTTICHELINRYNDYQYSISATTRPPRGRELNGVDYIFMTKAEFLKAEENNEFIETAQYLDNWYGTPRKSLMDAIQNGKIVLLDIDVQGGRSIIITLPEAVAIFLVPPSLEELKNRLTNRNTDSSEAINNRLEVALEELKTWNEYKYIVVNDVLDRAVDEVNSIINVERMKTKRLNDKKYWNSDINKLLELK